MRPPSPTAPPLKRRRRRAAKKRLPAFLPALSPRSPSPVVSPYPVPRNRPSRRFRAHPSEKSGAGAEKCRVPLGAEGGEQFFFVVVVFFWRRQKKL